MYFYHGNRHYFLTQVLINDNELKEVILANGLDGDFEQFAYSLSSAIWTNIDTFLKDNSLSVNEYYDQEFSAYTNNRGYVSTFLAEIQTVIDEVYINKRYWYMKTNKGLYVAILRSILYGSIKHFFFEHRDKYLPQYDWYLINNNSKRKDIMDMLFREFDKLATVADSLKYYQDPDDIPLEFLIYLQEITGLTVNNYDGVLNSDQIRSLTKHLIEVWRYKGSLFAIELFFACMGIKCTTRELWFDRRLYYNPVVFNEYTKVASLNSFGYYLTVKKPHITSYEYSPDYVDYSNYTGPRPSRIWDKKVSDTAGAIIPKLLGYEPSNESITFTYFKSNFILLDFSYPGQSRTVSKDELAIYKELVQHMLPAFVRVYYGNEYEDIYGSEDWDIFNAKDSSTTLIDNTGAERAATVLGLTDTQGINFGTEKNPAWVFDAYPTNLINGPSFISGSYVVMGDYLLDQYISNNEIKKLETLDNLVTSPRYDVIGGAIFASEMACNNYPIFYDNEGHEYRFKFTPTSDTSIDFTKTYYVYNDSKLCFEKEASPRISLISTYYELDETALVREDGIEGTLEITVSADKSDDGKETLTEYKFKVNNDEIRIYACLFTEDNNKSAITFYQGIWSNDENGEIFDYNDSEIDWTYGEGYPYETFDQKYSEKALNLFETSSYHDEALAINDLYNNDNSWNGVVQYDYVEFTNPLECVDSVLNEGLEITLI